MSLGVKNDSDLRFAWADLGAAAEGNSIRIRVLGLLVTISFLIYLSSPFNLKSYLKNKRTLQSKF